MHSESEENSPPELIEPFPWLNNPNQVGRYRGVRLVTPRQEVAWGVFLLAAGAVFSVILIARGDGGSMVLAVLLVLIFGGLGVTLLVMARARARWARNYRALHGRSPFPSR